MSEERYRVLRDRGGYYIALVDVDAKGEIEGWTGPIPLAAPDLDALQVIIDKAAEAIGDAEYGCVFEMKLGELTPTETTFDEDDEEPTCDSPHCLRSKCCEKARRR